MLHRSQPRRSIKSDTALPLDPFGPGHMPIHLPPDKKLACWLCHWKRRGDGRGSKDVPKLGGRVGGVTCPCVFLKIATALLNCMCLR